MNKYRMEKLVQRGEDTLPESHSSSGAEAGAELLSNESKAENFLPGQAPSWTPGFASQEQRAHVMGLQFGHVVISCCCCNK